LLSHLFDWRDSLVVVRPETLIRWHRAGWKLFWRLKSRPGRPPIPLEVQELIRRMANENPSWGEERIANELLLKLDIRVSPRTLNKYLLLAATEQPDYMDLSQQIAGAVRSEYLAGHGSAYPLIEAVRPTAGARGRRDSAHFAAALVGSSAGFT
jgi:hypothetical protein